MAGSGGSLLALVSVLLAAHPSLFFGASDVAALRQAGQTTHASIASHITAILDQHLNDPTPTATEYDEPEPEWAPTVQPVADPVTPKSPAARPVTDSLKVRL